MITQTLINASDLNAWSNRNDSSTFFPQLLRTLILGTVSSVRHIGFRSGEGVAIGGWDGRLDVEDGDAFVPTGKSVWELGTGKEVKGKADDDYDKRKAGPLDFVPDETTYVFVTTRRWGGKDDWIKSRQAEGFWKEVRAYDADDLATWLETAPHIHVWLSIILGKHPEAATDLSHFWNDWSGATDPPLTPELVVAGRNETVDRIHTFLREPPSALTLQSESKDEALAFFAAALFLLSEDERDYHLRRCIASENVLSWRHLTASPTPLLLAVNSDDRLSVSCALNNGHHVLIPLGKADPTYGQGVSIPRPHRADLETALANAGVARDTAAELATLGRRSLLALRRKLASVPDIKYPLWAAPNEARSILPILLAGKWIDTNQPDQDVLAKLAGTSYEMLNQVLSRWANEPDAPIKRVGSTWFLVSKEDAWSLIAKYLTREDLDNFARVFAEVFDTPDPAVELEPDTRWQANILGKVMPYSNYLREGMAETLAIMAARAATTQWLDASTGQERADMILWKLFDAANKDWRLWPSFAYQLPLLGEASPERFLEAIDAGLRGDDPAVMRLFSEGSGMSLGRSSYHPSLLWALEMLAWNPDYLSQCALLLAKLSRLDPGGNLGNRPPATLRGIFLSWYPQTNATLDKRLQTIDVLRRHEPDAAWNLMVALLPEMHSVGHPSSKPRWREWNIPSEPSVTYADIWKLTEFVVDRMLEDVGVSANRWSSLLYALGQVPKPQHQAIVESLDRLDVESFTTDDRTQIWETLRKIISKHREFADADWALPADVIDELEKVYDKFSPTDEIVLYSWLFGYGVELLHPPSDPENWQQREEIVNGFRKDALAKLYGSGRIDALLRLAESVEEPAHAGLLTAQIDILSPKDIDRVLDDHLDSENTHHSRFAKGLVTGFFRTQGWEWAEKKFMERWPDWTARHRSNFIASLFFEPNAWDLLESTKDPETESDYWSRILPGYNKSDDFERPVRKLIEYKRPQFAVAFLAHRTYEKEAVVPAELALEVLEGLISVTSESETQIAWGNIGHDLTRLMRVVRSSSDIDESRIAQIEFLIFPLLENYGDGPKILHGRLARDPAFFADLIKVIFRSEDENAEQSTVSESYITAAFKLLNSWRICPGTNEDGTLDRTTLRGWVEQARKLVHESGRGVIGDQQIGQAFAESPFGSDNVHPHEYVRELIEELANTEIERGYEVRIFNNRGVTVRNPTDGGGLERALVVRYRSDAEKIGDNSPRTAAMLRRLAESYDRHARREDASAALTEDFWR
ncbi:MAG TPA: hypothetical protein PLK77_01250 [Pyrinomonadaceae bacterium]|nr:hypothetical protein [Pyrinomonadaceae bacterium]